MRGFWQGCCMTTKNVKGAESSVDEFRISWRKLSSDVRAEVVEWIQRRYCLKKPFYSSKYRKEAVYCCAGTVWTVCQALRAVWERNTDWYLCWINEQIGGLDFLSRTQRAHSGLENVRKSCWTGQVVRNPRDKHVELCGLLSSWTYAGGVREEIARLETTVILLLLQGTGEFRQRKSL